MLSFSTFQEAGVYLSYCCHTNVDLLRKIWDAAGRDVFRAASFCQDDEFLRARFPSLDLGVFALHRNAIDLDSIFALFDEHHVRPFVRECDGYPDALLDDDSLAPVVLYVVGTGDIPSRSIAVVGTRKYSSSSFDRYFVGELARAGWCIVSGMARGVDRMAHLACIDAGGVTISVIGCGFGKCDIRFANRIISSGGLVISEYPFDAFADKYMFPRRNRIVAALTRGTLVVSAPARSGALITASDALDIGRVVCGIPGLPTDPYKKGIVNFVNDYAIRLVCDPVDVLNLFGESVAPQASYRAKNHLDYTLLSSLSSPCTLDELCKKTSFSFLDVYSHMIALESDEAVRRDGDTWSSLVALSQEKDCVER